MINGHRLTFVSSVGWSRIWINVTNQYNQEKTESITWIYTSSTLDSSLDIRRIPTSSVHILIILNILFQNVQ